MKRWTIEMSDAALRALRKLLSSDRDRVLDFLQNRLQSRDDPRALGQALKGSRFGGLWRYRVGDYRIIASLEDEKLVILFLKIGHRREVYD